MPFWSRKPRHDGENYGPHEVEQAVSMVPFPITRDDLMAHWGAKAVQIERGHAVDLGSILKRLPAQTFESPADLRASVEALWEEVRRIPPYTGYPGEESWTGGPTEPEAMEHVRKDLRGDTGEQHRLREG